MPRFRTERGQALPLLLVVLVVALLAVVVIGRVGAAADDAAQARTAADAAALAGAAHGRSEAERIARANGGVLTSYASIGAQVEVVVRVGAVDASARAEETVVWVPRDSVVIRR